MLSQLPKPANVDRSLRFGAAPELLKIPAGMISTDCQFQKVNMLGLFSKCFFYGFEQAVRTAEVSMSNYIEETPSDLSFVQVQRTHTLIVLNKEIKWLV